MVIECKLCISDEGSVSVDIYLKANKDIIKCTGKNIFYSCFKLVAKY